jgi:hypothetical protein
VRTLDIGRVCIFTHDHAMVVRGLCRRVLPGAV